MTFKHWLLVSAALYSAGLAWGILTPPGSTGLLADNLSVLKSLSSFVASLPLPALFLFIFIKNVLAVAAGFVLSPFLLLVPVMELLLNGGLLGLVSVSVVQQKSFGFLLSGVLPHGIIEIPAMIIGEAAALSFGIAVMRSLVNEQARAELPSSLKKNLRYLAIAVIMLFPAALIETYVTPLFVR